MRRNPRVVALTLACVAICTSIASCTPVSELPVTPSASATSTASQTVKTRDLAAAPPASMDISGMPVIDMTTAPAKLSANAKANIIAVAQEQSGGEIAPERVTPLLDYESQGSVAITLPDMSRFNQVSFWILCDSDKSYSMTMWSAAKKQVGWVAGVSCGNMKYRGGGTPKVFAAGEVPKTFVVEVSAGTRFRVGLIGLEP